MSNSTEDKKIIRVIYALSVIIPLAVALLMVLPAQWKEGLGISENSAVSSFPFLHAVLNGATFVCLVAAGIAIKNKKITVHKTFMLTAFVLSSLFLISYVIYHLTHPKSMLRQNVGMSFDVMAERKFALQAEERALRMALDSLRFAAQSDSLAYAALIFRKERQYGTAVVELTNAERKLEELKSYKDAPAPKSYSISPAMPVEKPVGLPAWVIGILGAVLVAGGLKLWAASTS